MIKKIMCGMMCLVCIIGYHMCLSHCELSEQEKIEEIQDEYKEYCGVVVDKDIVYTESYDQTTHSRSLQSDFCLIIEMNKSRPVKETDDSYFVNGARSQDNTICYSATKDVYQDFDVGDEIELLYLDGQWGYNETILARHLIGFSNIGFFLGAVFSVIGTFVGFGILIFLFCSNKKSASSI